MKMEAKISHNEFIINKTIDEYLQYQTFKNPNSIAVKFGDIEIIYKDLNDRVNILATKLKKIGSTSTFVKTPNSCK